MLHFVVLITPVACGHEFIISVAFGHEFIISVAFGRELIISVAFRHELIISVAFGIVLIISVAYCFKFCDNGIRICYTWGILCCVDLLILVLYYH